MARLFEDYVAERMARDPKFAASCEELERDAEFQAELARIKASVVTPTKREWILLALRNTSLDRVHVMQLLFLTWYWTGQNIEDFFEFRPHYWGPYSQEVQDILDKLVAEGLIVQSPYVPAEVADYYLTEQGAVVLEESIGERGAGVIDLLDKVVQELAPLDFKGLLQYIYAEAPEFAVTSLANVKWERDSLSVRSVLSGE